MRRGGERGRRLLGAVMALTGVLIVFLCLPMEFFLIVLGTLLAGLGLYLCGG
ncbi:MAG: hypothetical protein IJN79_05640 [Clostridia bacterium]|nr:hypothetical protein [Clostridia bacterium]MBQ2949147.1 hypothetical protein [Clostridia bacterium]MBQ4609763.1 hypothetical protein [Clostridia bacterium]MBQ6858485.1 hypothetical protein [Clostridia bacterium]MBQ7052258.1 hypothetical protein [Clostridia bacterium]